MTILKRLKRFSALDLVEGLSTSMDLVSQSLVNHHRRVAFICWQLANELGLPEQQKKDLIIAAMLHDCGALSLSLRMLGLHFELKDSEDFSVNRHAEAGYQLLKKFAPFSRVAEIVRYHHCYWDGSSCPASADIPEESHILHLADRLDILLRKSTRIDVLSYRQGILQQIRQQKGSMFQPDLIEPLEKMMLKDTVLLDFMNESLCNSLTSYMDMGREQIDCDNALEMTEIYSNVIDFRSNHTASHSRMVSTFAGVLARMMGFSEEGCIMVKIAGNLHDLGKLAIPLAILEKPEKLTKEERWIINSHSYYTYKILAKFREMKDIRNWAAYHHERIDGSGYPFRIGGDELDLGSRIVAVADVYAALREKRSYKDRMAPKEIVAVLGKMAGTALDKDLIGLVVDRQQDIEHIMAVTEEHCLEDYTDFSSSIQD